MQYSDSKGVWSCFLMSGVRIDALFKRLYENSFKTTNTTMALISTLIFNLGRYCSRELSNYMYDHAMKLTRETLHCEYLTWCSCKPKYMIAPSCDGGKTLPNHLRIGRCWALHMIRAESKQISVWNPSIAINWYPFFFFFRIQIYINPLLLKQRLLIEMLIKVKWQSTCLNADHKWKTTWIQGSYWFIIPHSSMHVKIEIPKNLNLCWSTCRYSPLNLKEKGYHVSCSMYMYVVELQWKG